MKTIFSCAVMALVFAFTSSNKLIGRWETQPSVNGNITGVVFRTDNSFDAYVNKKSFAVGVYSLEDSVFSFTDNGCDGVKGTYIIHFFSNDDSLKLEPIKDSCLERKEGMRRLVLGRVKK